MKTAERDTAMLYGRPSVCPSHAGITLKRLN